jgi:hypothetical protein
MSKQGVHGVGRGPRHASNRISDADDRIVRAAVKCDLFFLQARSPAVFGMRLSIGELANGAA